MPLHAGYDVFNVGAWGWGRMDRREGPLSKSFVLEGVIVGGGRTGAADVRIDQAFSELSQTGTWA